MKKLIAALITGLFAVSAFAADAPASASAAASTDASAPKAKKMKKAKAKKAEAKVDAAAGAGVLVTVHKGGSRHKTVVSASVLAAAERLREKGRLPEYHLFRVLRRVSTKLKLKVAVTAGSFRHTVATEAIERGATPEQVSAFLGHKSPQTTKKFYATLAVAPKIPTLA